MFCLKCSSVINAPNFPKKSKPLLEYKHFYREYILPWGYIDCKGLDWWARAIDLYTHIFPGNCEDGWGREFHGSTFSSVCLLPSSDLMKNPLYSKAFLILFQPCSWSKISSPPQKKYSLSHKSWTFTATISF